MNSVAILSGLGCVGGAVLIFRAAKQERIYKRAAATLKMTPIRDLKPGLVLTEGEVVCKSPIETPYTKTDAAWYGYSATRMERSSSSAGFVERSLAKGSRSCPFTLKDRTGEVEVIGAGGQVCSYPHRRILKSESGYSVPLKNRIKKLKEMDAKKHLEGTKKPFFRKFDVEDEPLDIPPDLIEISTDPKEVKRTHKKYYESWIQAGDHIYVLGTAVKDTGPQGLKIVKADKQSPLLVSKERHDLSSGTFQSNWMTMLVVGTGLTALGIILLLMGLGVVDI